MAAAKKPQVPAPVLVSTQLWLAKSEPETYSFERLVREGRSSWDGVRNYQARNCIRAARPGDLWLFYHSGKSPALVGVAEVTSAARPEPGAETFSVVDVVPRFALRRPLPLAEIKADSRLAELALVRHSRLSVMPVTPEQLTALEELAGQPLRVKQGRRKPGG